MLAVKKCCSINRPCLKTMLAMAELRRVSCRLKRKKIGDDPGFVARFLKHSPDGFLNALLHVMTEVLQMFHLPDKLRFSMCFRKQMQQCQSLISGLLRIYVCSMYRIQTLCIPLILGRIEKSLEKTHTHGGALSPWKRQSNISAKSWTRGWSATSWHGVRSMPRSIFHDDSRMSSTWTPWPVLESGAAGRTTWVSAGTTRWTPCHI